MRTGFNFTTAAVAEWIECVLETMLKAMFAKVTQAKPKAMSSQASSHAMISQVVDSSQDSSHSW